MNAAGSTDAQLGLEAGDGLGASAALIDAVIAPVLRLPDQREDGFRLVDRAGPRVVTSDVFAVDPLVFPGGDIGLLAAAGVCNDLLASGARITEVALGVYASSFLATSTLRACLDSFGSALDSLGASVVCGDTKVHSERQPELLLFATGLGVALSERRFDLADTLAGDDIIVTGPLGDHAIAVLSAREGLGFESVVSSDARPLNGPIEELIARNLVHSLRDLTRGGLVAAVWDGFVATGLGWAIDDEHIPVHRPVRAAAEMLGLDVLTLTNEGSMLITAPIATRDQILTVLRSWPQTAESAVIGTVTDRGDTSGPVLVGPRGTRRPITLPYGIGVPRLC